MQAKQGHVNWDGGEIYYEVTGTGTPLVLVHAGFLDSRMFDAQWQALAQLFRVIRYDMRGFGQSSPASGPVCRRAELQTLLDHLQVEQAHFVGCSMGGTTVLDLALEQPERVLSLTLVGATPGGFVLQGEPPPFMMEMFGALQNGDFEQASELQLRIWIDGGTRNPDDIAPDLREKARIMNRIPVERQTTFIADMQPVCPLEPSAVTRLDALGCPVLVVAGALDHTEILRAADCMVKEIPGARKAIIDAAGHVPSFEQPEAFNTLLLDFLRPSN